MLKRWVQISSLGVYAARDHFGTDESEPMDLDGLDGYTRTKAEAEVVIRRHVDECGLPAVILRPGFTYGPGERHVIPRLIRRFRDGTVRLIGDGKKSLNNTAVSNLADAVLLALASDGVNGHAFNIRDERLVTRVEYLQTVAEFLKRPMPGRVPLWVARAAVTPIEGFAKLSGRSTAPLLTSATIKFMALNLDFSIQKAKDILGYRPRIDFSEGMPEALRWATRGTDAPAGSGGSA